MGMAMMRIYKSHPNAANIRIYKFVICSIRIRFADLDHIVPSDFFTVFWPSGHERLLMRIW